MAINKDDNIFGDTSFSDVLKKIHDNQQTKSGQINTLINQLKPLVTKITDAALIVPLIKEYLDISVKNDDQLVKLATVYQRYIQAENRVFDNPDNDLLSDQEKEDLLQTNRENFQKDLINSKIIDENSDIEKKMKELTDELDGVIKKENN